MLVSITRLQENSIRTSEVNFNVVNMGTTCIQLGLRLFHPPILAPIMEWGIAGTTKDRARAREVLEGENNNDLAFAGKMIICRISIAYVHMCGQQGCTNLKVSDNRPRPIIGTWLNLNLSPNASRRTAT
jgi:hypothetical protein